jgi:hypothetical protein
MVWVGAVLELRWGEVAGLQSRRDTSRRSAGGLLPRESGPHGGSKVRSAP